MESSTTKPLCSTWCFQPCLAAGKSPCLLLSHPWSRFRGRDDVTGKAGGRARGWACAGMFHVSAISKSPLRAASPCAEGRFLGPNQHCQTPLCCPPCRAAPRGPLQLGLGGTLHHTGCPGSPWPAHTQGPHLLKGEEPRFGADLLGMGALSRAKSAQIPV